MIARLLPAIALLGVSIASTLQQPQRCRLQPSPGGQLTTTNGGTPYEMTFIAHPILRCSGGVMIQADSAVRSALAHQVEFIGHVNYADTLKTLQSDHAYYFEGQGHVATQGNVILQDLKTGSTITAPTLDYYLKSETNPEPRIAVYNGRPHTVLYQDRQGEPAQPGDTTIVDSDNLTIWGERFVQFGGDVRIVRGTMKAFGARAQFDNEQHRMQLLGAGRVEGEDFNLYGDTVVAELQGDTNRFREVTARRESRLLARDVDIHAPMIHVLFTEGKVSRLVALRPHPTAADSAAVATLPQARAIATDFFLRADSIDAIAPDQKLDTVYAVGAAYGERRDSTQQQGAGVTADSSRATALAVRDSAASGTSARPDTTVVTASRDSTTRADSVALALDSVPAVMAHDWLSGDTVVALFKAAEGNVPDTARNSRVLERVIARGGATQPARSMYRMEQPDQEVAGRHPISYLVAREITVILNDGKVATVGAREQIQGLYLEPVKPTQVKKAEPDTAAARKGRKTP